jgi:hypothetical protein
VIESEPEIGHVTETVSLPFEGFDFVIDAFKQGTGDTVKVVVQEAVTEMHQGVGDPFELFDA